MHPATFNAFQDELVKIAHYQDSYGEPGRPAPGTGKKVLKGALLGAGVVGGGLAAKHYGGKALKSGISAAKGHLSEAVEEGIKKGTKGALWNALKRK